MMLIGITFIVVGVFISVLLILHKNNKLKTPFTKKYDETLLYLKEKLHLSYTNIGHTIYGAFNSGLIKVRKIESENYNSYRIRIEHTVPIQGIVKITTENTLSKAKKVVGSEDILIGDPHFDDYMLLKASQENKLLPLLHSQLRKKIRKLAKDSMKFEISNSWIIAEYSEQHFHYPVKLLEIISTLKEISQELCNENIKEIIESNILTDPIENFRLRNLHILLSDFNSEDNSSTLKEALADKSHSMQILAASNLEKEGMEHLEKMLVNIKNNFHENKKEFNTITYILAGNNHIESIDLLKKLYKEIEESLARESILKAFTLYATTELHDFLLIELNSIKEEKNIPLLKELIAALGTCGSIEAVETLVRLTEDDTYSLLKKEIQKSISHIQSRLGDVESGWTSLSDHNIEEGKLSKASDKSGSLSKS